MRPGRDIARPRPPGRGRCDRRAGTHAAPRFELLRQPGGHRDGDDDRRAAGWGRTGVLLQLGGGGERGRLQAGAQVRRARDATSSSSAFGSFHGRTLAALAATGQPSKHEPFQPMPEGFRHVPFGDLDALAGAIDPSVAAVLIEPVQGEGGVVAGPARLPRRDPDAVRRARGADDRRRGADRASPARGAGSGSSTPGVRPDVVCLAKAIGNGMPIGACWARREVAAVLQPGDHGSTYSGTPIATAAAGARHRRAAPDRRPGAGAARRRSPAAPAAVALPGVTEVRGLGLLLAAELDGRDSKAVTAACLERGLVVNNITPTALRLAPPVTVSEAEIDEAMAIVREVLAYASEAAPATRPGRHRPGPRRAARPCWRSPSGRSRRSGDRWPARGWR